MVFVSFIFILWIASPCYARLAHDDISVFKAISKSSLKDSISFLETNADFKYILKSVSSVIARLKKPKQPIKNTNNITNSKLDFKINLESIIDLKKYGLSRRDYTHLQ